MVHAQPQNPEVGVDFPYQSMQGEDAEFDASFRSHVLQHGEDLAGMNVVEEAPDETMQETEILPGDV